MAKRNKKTNKRAGVKSKSFTKTLPRTRITPISSTHSKLTLATLIDDRRRWNPIKKRARPHLTFSGTIAPTFTQVKSQPHRRLYETSTYILPKQTAVCVKRQTRKEVLFAKGRAGRKTYAKRVRRTPQSYISCKK